MACRDEGVILRTLGDVVVIMPPLAMTPDDLRTVVNALSRAIRRVLG
jgi:adenosylmethionine-8-amino-7-oxononanoate aminotransferase